MVISSANTPCLSGQKNRDLNQVERELTDLKRQAFSVPVVPVDPLTETDERNDIRTMQRVG